MFFFYKCVLCTQLEPSENEWSVIADWSVYSSSGALKSFPRPGKVRFSVQRLSKTSPRALLDIKAKRTHLKDIENYTKDPNGYIEIG